MNHGPFSNTHCNSFRSKNLNTNRLPLLAIVTPPRFPIFCQLLQQPIDNLESYQWTNPLNSFPIAWLPTLVHQKEAWQPCWWNPWHEDDPALNALWSKEEGAAESLLRDREDSRFMAMAFQWVLAEERGTEAFQKWRETDNEGEKGGVHVSKGRDLVSLRMGVGEEFLSLSLTHFSLPLAKDPCLLL